MNTRVTMRLLATAILAMSILSVVQIADSSAKLRQRDDQIAQLINNFTTEHATQVSSAVPASDKH